MKNLCLPVALSCLFALPAAQAANLVDALESALRSDPQLREAEANRLAALESKPQARAALLPQLDLSWINTNQDQDGTNSFFDSNTGQFFDTGFESEDDQDFMRLELRQSVFSWDQWVALRQADATIAQSEADYRAAEQDLLVRVSQRYFDVLAAEDELESVQANKEAVARQLEQAETRFEVGLIAITDVREAQAGYDEAVANEIAAKRVLATAKELLREFTGEYFDDLNTPGDELPLIPPDPQAVEDWVATAMAQNISLTSSRLAVEIASEEIRSRRAGHYPSLDLVVRRDEFDSQTDQVLFDPVGGAVPSDTSVDFTTDAIQLQLTVPLFSGGFTSSRVREAVYQHRAAKERLERVARETERLARDSYEGVISEIARVGALSQALESSRTALAATEAGFEVGTRTTVDVLNARRDMFRARTNFLKSRYEYILNVLNLKLAAGTLTKEDVDQFNRWLRERPPAPMGSGG